MRSLRSRAPGSSWGQCACCGGAAYLVSADASDKIAKWYQNRFQQGGWKLVRFDDRGSRHQVVYQKANEFVAVLIQEREVEGGRTGIMLIKGGKELVESLARQRADQ